MLHQTLYSAAAILGLLASSTNAHMMMNSPVPYGKGSLNNSPLENDGSDFPCKQRSGVYDVTQMNSMPVGVPQKLSFTGGATHGGGSCQVSVTLDKEPTKDSEWKVIHSIVGGCPSSSPENLSDDPADDGAGTFQFSIPKGMPNGQYTLAWTWFNKIGNREMYMNCAPIEVTGGSSNNDVYDTLPTMFVINIPNEQCGIEHGQDFVFPDPGLYVETAQQTALGSKTTGSNCAAVTAKGAGKGSAGSPAAPTEYNSVSAAPTATQAPNYESDSAPEAVYTSAPASTPAAYQVVPTFPAVAKGIEDVVIATTMATVTATGYAPIAARPTQYATSESAGPETNGTVSSGTCSSGAVTCNSPGNVVCIGSNQWGLCNIDNCAISQELSAGTSCSGGVISKRQEAHLRRHIHHGRSW